MTTTTRPNFHGDIQAALDYYNAIKKEVAEALLAALPPRDISQDATIENNSTDMKLI